MGWCKLRRGDEYKPPPCCLGQWQQYRELFPYGQVRLLSFRGLFPPASSLNNCLSSGYLEPTVYPGPQLSSTMYTKFNATHFSYTFRCQDCMSWGSGGGFDPNGPFVVMGWAQSFSAVGDITNPGSSLLYHDNGFGQFGIDLDLARQPGYAGWIATNPGTPTIPPPATTVTPPVVTATSTAVLGTYDYVVVGGGPAGIVGL